MLRPPPPPGHECNKQTGESKRDPKRSSRRLRRWLRPSNLAEPGYVAALWQLNYESVSLAFLRVIIPQPRPKPDRLRAHHWVQPGIETGTPPKHLDGDKIGRASCRER